MKRLTNWFNYLFEANLTETQFALALIATVFIIAFLVSALMIVPAPFE